MIIKFRFTIHWICVPIFLMVLWMIWVSHALYGTIERHHEIDRKVSSFAEEANDAWDKCSDLEQRFPDKSK